MQITSKDVIVTKYTYVSKIKVPVAGLEPDA